MRWLALTVVMLLAGPAWSGGAEEAKAHYKRGVSLFALERFAEAAQEYEKAFELEPDPALLYNAAQAHRLAANKQRALTLYQSYLRMFQNPANKRDVERHIVALKSAIESEGKAQTSPPTDTIPPKPSIQPTTQPVTAPEVVQPPPEPEQPRPQPSKVAPTAAVVATPAPERKRTPTWVWGVVGGVGAVVVIGVAVGLGVGLSGTEYPAASVTARVE
jgi:tetratricopeptide (TPR) repeat protein